VHKVLVLSSSHSLPMPLSGRQRLQGSLLMDNVAVMTGEVAARSVGSPAKEGIVLGAVSPRRAALVEMQSPARRGSESGSGSGGDLPGLASTSTVEQAQVRLETGARRAPRLSPRRTPPAEATRVLCVASLRSPVWKG
jgi:hypothetical protein